MDTPRLEVLQCFDIERVELEHPETIKSDFFVKLSSIKTVSAVEEVDRNQFERFLKNLSELNYLSLIDTWLGQEFLDCFPSI